MKYPCYIFKKKKLIEKQMQKQRDIQQTVFDEIDKCHAVAFAVGTCLV